MQFTFQQLFSKLEAARTPYEYARAVKLLGDHDLYLEMVDDALARPRSRTGLVNTVLRYSAKHEEEINRTAFRLHENDDLGFWFKIHAYLPDAGISQDHYHSGAHLSLTDSNAHWNLDWRITGLVYDENPDETIETSKFLAGILPHGDSLPLIQRAQATNLRKLWAGYPSGAGVSERVDPYGWVEVASPTANLANRHGIWIVNEGTGHAAIPMSKGVTLTRFARLGLGGPTPQESPALILVDENWQPRPDMKRRMGRKQVCETLEIVRTELRNPRTVSNHDALAELGSIARHYEHFQDRRDILAAGAASLVAPPLDEQQFRERIEVPRVQRHETAYDVEFALVAIMRQMHIESGLHLHRALIDAPVQAMQPPDGLSFELASVWRWLGTTLEGSDDAGTRLDEAFSDCVARASERAGRQLTRGDAYAKLQRGVDILRKAENVDFNKAFDNFVGERFESAYAREQLLQNTVTEFAAESPLHLPFSTTLRKERASRSKLASVSDEVYEAAALSLLREMIPNWVNSHAATQLSWGVNRSRPPALVVDLPRKAERLKEQIPVDNQTGRAVKGIFDMLAGHILLADTALNFAHTQVADDTALHHEINKVSADHIESMQAMIDVRIKELLARSENRRGHSFTSHELRRQFDFVFRDLGLDYGARTPTDHRRPAVSISNFSNSLREFEFGSDPRAAARLVMQSLTGKGKQATYITPTVSGEPTIYAGLGTLVNANDLRFQTGHDWLQKFEIPKSLQIADLRTGHARRPKIRRAVAWQMAVEIDEVPDVLVNNVSDWLEDRAEWYLRNPTSELILPRSGAQRIMSGADRRLLPATIGVATECKDATVHNFFEYFGWMVPRARSTRELVPRGTELTHVQLLLDVARQLGAAPEDCLVVASPGPMADAAELIGARRETAQRHFDLSLSAL